MNKLAIFALSLAASTSMLAAPLAAQEIIVSPEPAQVRAVESDLNQQLGKVHFMSSVPEYGVASIRFRAGEDGRPHDIETYRSSGSNLVDNFARRAVARLTSLEPLSYGGEEGHLVQANIIVASSQSHLDQLTRRLERAEARRMASSPGEKAVLALNSVRSPAR